MPAPADTLVFANGDRLTGLVLKADSSKIHFQSDALGMVVVAADGAVVHPESNRSESVARVAGSPVGAPRGKKRETLDAVQSAPSPRPPSERARYPVWEKQLEFGITDQSGRRDRRDIAVRIDLTRATESGEIRLKGRYLSGEVDSETATDKFGGALRLRRGLTPELFAQMETRYERDSLSPIEHDAEQSFGLGTRLVSRDGFTLSVGGGAAARFRDSLATSDGWSYLVDAFQEFKYALGHHVTLSQDMSVVMSPSQEEVFAVKLNAALSSALTETINLVMRYEFEYDHSLAPSARENKRLVTSFGYLF